MVTSDTTLDRPGGVAARLQRWDLVTRARLLSLVFCLAIACLWFPTAQEHEGQATSPGTWSSRFATMKTVIEMSNKGYHYQFQPGKAMEWDWEDPGFSFYTVSWGFVKRALGLGPLDAFEDPYVVQFLFLVGVIFMLHARRIFRLEPVHYAVISLFFLMAVLPWWQVFDHFPNGRLYDLLPDGLFYLASSTRWAKVLAAPLTFAITLSLVAWSRDPERDFSIRSLATPALATGLAVGALGSIRKDSLQGAATGIALALGWIWLSHWWRAAPSGRYTARKLAIGGTAFLALFMLASQVPKWGFYATWWMRDRIYTMDDTPRTYGHPTWHVLYISLGFVDNPLGIKWDDGNGYEHMKKIPGNEKVVYATAEYERVMRGIFLDTIRQYPTLLPRNIVAKAVRLYEEQRRLILMGMAGLLILWLAFAHLRTTAAVLAGNWVATMFVPVVVYPYIAFYLDFVSHGLLILLMLTALTGQRVLHAVLQPGSLATGRNRRDVQVAAAEPIAPAPARPSRSDLKSRLFNEGDRGPKALLRASVIYGGFLLTRVFESTGLFRTRWGRRTYYAIYSLGKSFTDHDKLALMKTYIRPGDTVLDIGGAFGFMADKAAGMVGPGGRVVVIEPDPLCQRFIEDLMTAGGGGASNVELKRMAAWHEKGELTLNLCPENRGENSLFKSQIHEQSVRVPADRLDAVLGADTVVTFIKLDIQGAECSALAGLEAILTGRERIAILTECSPDDLRLAGETVERMIGQLRDAGLSIYRLDRSPMQRVMSAADLNDLSRAPFLQCDLLAVKGGA